MRTTKQDFQIMSKIVDRAIKSRISPWSDKLSLFMDIEFTHEERPLKLMELLHADNSNFAHDICGIQRNFNRSTKVMDNCFLPRFTA